MKRMLLILTIVALILSFSNVSMAQITEKGVKAGFYMANASGSDADDLTGDIFEKKARNGFAVGVYALYPLNESITLRPEVLYCQKGVKYEGSGTETVNMGYGYTVDYEYDGTIDVSLTYLEIPVLFQYDIASSGNMKPFVFAGPYLAFNMGAKMKMDMKVTAMGHTETESESEDMKDDVKSMDYGLVVGVGAKVTDKIHIDARYSMGMTSIDDTSDDLDLKNTVIAVTAGFALN
ncbi:PorT family protein [candidate division KSB1 bacterium]|nr:PorT family protein [candidate division KSB1 bacterium]